MRPWRALMTVSPSLCNCGSFAYRTVNMTLCHYRIQVCNRGWFKGSPLLWTNTVNYLHIRLGCDSLLRVTCGFVLRYTEHGVSFQPVPFDFTCSFVHRFLGAAWWAGDWFVRCLAVGGKKRKESFSLTVEVFCFFPVLILRLGWC